MKPRIYYTKPSITELEVGYATDAARNGWGERCYDYIHRFEAQFREHLGVRFAIATSSCTGALHMGMAGLGIGPGDEVILADTNWIASVSPVVHLGATPVFVDILADSWCLDPDEVEVRRLLVEELRLRPGDRAVPRGEEPTLTIAGPGPILARACCKSLFFSARRRCEPLLIELC